MSNLRNVEIRAEPLAAVGCMITGRPRRCRLSRRRRDPSRAASQRAPPCLCHSKRPPIALLRLRRCHRIAPRNSWYARSCSQQRHQAPPLPGDLVPTTRVIRDGPVEGGDQGLESHRRARPSSESASVYSAPPSSKILPQTDDDAGARLRSNRVGWETGRADVELSAPIGSRGPIAEDRTRRKNRIRR